MARLPIESYHTLTVLVFLAISAGTVAQYPPQVTGLTELRSPVDPNVFIRYKTPDSSICNTTNPLQKQYSGHLVGLSHRVTQLICLRTISLGLFV